MLSPKHEAMDSWDLTAGWQHSESISLPRTGWKKTIENNWKVYVKFPINIPLTIFMACNKPGYGFRLSVIEMNA
jgi:hypothetical protein